jgi:CRP-like cAMP-binding protein
MNLTLEEILVKMIKAIPIFSWIKDEEALELARKFKLNYYPKWSLIIREWTYPEKIYILKNGKLEARKAHWLSKIILWEIKPGEIFGEMSFFYNKPTMASVVAVEEYWLKQTWFNRWFTWCYSEYSCCLE